MITPQSRGYISKNILQSVLMILNTENNVFFPSSIK
uniref:Uncharacterized protein n=1 Tax=Anguilla anguilla TaxID=7936 RepID=A0A0E9UFN4_ANGAN